MGEKDLEVGTRIKKIRQNKNITQKELASLLGTSQTAIALWENGSRNISLGTAEEIAKKLNVSPAYLLFGDAEIESNTSPAEKNTTTIAAHFDGDEYTEEELEEIKQFAEFVKSKRKNSKTWKNSVTKTPSHLEVNAAHARTDIDIPEDADTSDDDIMNDENF